MKPGKIAAMMIPGITSGILTGMQLGMATGMAVGIPGGPVGMAVFSVGLGIAGAIVGGLAGLLTYKFGTKLVEPSVHSIQQREQSDAKAKSDANKFATVYRIMKRLKKDSQINNTFVASQDVEKQRGILYELNYGAAEDESLLGKTQRQVFTTQAHIQRVNSAFSRKSADYEQQELKHNAAAERASESYAALQVANDQVNGTGFRGWFAPIRRWFAQKRLSSDELKYHSLGNNPVSFFSGQSVDLDGARETIKTVEDRQRLLSSLLATNGDELSQIDDYAKISLSR